MNFIFLAESLKYPTINIVSDGSYENSILRKRCYICGDICRSAEFIFLSIDIDERHRRLWIEPFDTPIGKFIEH